MISVIIPTYNREKTIRRAIKSVLDQTYRDLELIIVDDCSADNTEELIRSIPDEHIRYIRHEMNKGACAARNTGIEAAKGEYIAFQDSDDRWHKDKLEKQMAVLQRENADIVFCKMIRYENRGCIGTFPKKFSEGFLADKTDITSIGTQTLIARKEVFNEFRFDEEMPRFQELELLMRALKKYDIYCIEEPLVDYYLAKDSISMNPERLYKACKLMLEKNPEIRTEYRSFAQMAARRLYKESYYLKNGSSLKTKDMWKLALQYDGRWKCKAKYIMAKVGVLALYYRS